MLSTDSGFRYIAYGYGVPTLTYSKQSREAFNSIPSHQVRWLMFPETCFLNFDLHFISDAIDRITESKGYILAPYVQDLKMQLVKREYKINLEKAY